MTLQSSMSMIAHACLSVSKRNSPKYTTPQSTLSTMPATSALSLIIVKKTKQFKRFVRTTVATSHNLNSKDQKMILDVFAVLVVWV